MMDVFYWCWLHSIPVSTEVPENISEMISKARAEGLAVKPRTWFVYLDQKTGDRMRYFLQEEDFADA